MQVGGARELRLERAQLVLVLVGEGGELGLQRGRLPGELDAEALEPRLELGLGELLHQLAHDLLLHGVLHGAKLRGEPQLERIGRLDDRCGESLLVGGGLILDLNKHVRQLAHLLARLRRRLLHRLFARRRLSLYHPVRLGEHLCLELGVHVAQRAGHILDALEARGEVNSRALELIAQHANQLRRLCARLVKRAVVAVEPIDRGDDCRLELVQPTARLGLDSLERLGERAQVGAHRVELRVAPARRLGMPLGQRRSVRVQRADPFVGGGRTRKELRALAPTDGALANLDGVAEHVEEKATYHVLRRDRRRRLARRRLHLGRPREKAVNLRLLLGHRLARRRVARLDIGVQFVDADGKELEHVDERRHVHAQREPLDARRRRRHGDGRPLARPLAPAGPRNDPGLKPWS